MKDLINLDNIGNPEVLEKRLKTMEEKKNGKKCKSDTCNC